MAANMKQILTVAKILVNMIGIRNKLITQFESIESPLHLTDTAHNTIVTITSAATYTTFVIFINYFFLLHYDNSYSVSASIILTSMLLK